jgi:hypothetical protein
MKHWKSLAFIILFITHAQAQVPAVVEERLYYDFQKHILQDVSAQKGQIGLSPFEQSLYVDALWDLVEEASPEGLQVLKQLHPFHYELKQRLRIAILRLRYHQSAIPQELLDDVHNALVQPEVEVQLIYLLASYESLLSPLAPELYAVAKLHPNYFDVTTSPKRSQLPPEVVADLFHESPDLRTYMNGRYQDGIKLFMFCRANRLFPCLMVMRDIHGDPVRNMDGSLWTHPALASSTRGLPSNIRNGDTAAGIYSIDSVMPHADQQLSFGKFRRMIINFIPGSKNEQLMKSLLPESSHRLDWWMPTVVARDVGRNLFRIHGTGRINHDRSASFWPFMRTSGCIAQRENTYDKITFEDQRILLDKVMQAMNLTPNFANETRVKGILYMLELDNRNAPVTIRDLRLRGIE